VLVGLAGWYFVAVRPFAPPAQAHATHNQATPAPTPTSTAIPASDWQTQQTFSGPSTGNGTKHTQTFTVSKTWQITWTCQGINGVDEWLYIAVYHTNGTLYNAAAQVTCIAAKKVIGSTIEQAGGTFYLTVDASTDWTITIQTLIQ
jgi:hypothetical protein